MGERYGKQSIVKDNQQSSETEVQINKKVSKCEKSCAKVVHGSDEQKNLVITIHLKRRMEHNNNNNQINSNKSNIATATSPSTAATKSNNDWDEKLTNSINNNNNNNNNNSNSNSKKNPTTTKSNDTNNNSNVKHNCNGAVSKNDSGYKGLVKFIFSSKGNNDNINNNNNNNNSSISTTTPAPIPAPIATVVPNKNSYTRVVVSHIDRSTSTCQSAADIEHSFNALAISPNHQFVNALTGNTMDVINQIPLENRR